VIFGPITSRRFGVSLGIDLSPNIKQCNFDCLYCELRERAKQVGFQSQTVPVDTIVSDIEEALNKFPNIDVLTFTANGEPTLYPELDELISKVSPIAKKFKTKTLILSNGGNSWLGSIQKSLLQFDKVKLSLDCVTEECFNKLDRPLKGITIEDIKNGIIEFSKIFKGELYIETLFVNDINTKSEEILEINRFFQKVPTVFRIDLGTVERPPIYDVKPISYEKLYSIARSFSSTLPIMIVRRQNRKERNLSLSKTELLKTLSLRPLTRFDISSLCDEVTQRNFRELIVKKELVVEKIGDIEFFRPTY
jgi:wyosine [tRNA(Phe)-imidazoG37] synthetase (radical SAM superfamily)